jgi:hypothetical protein
MMAMSLSPTWLKVTHNIDQSDEGATTPLQCATAFAAGHSRIREARNSFYTCKDGKIIAKGSYWKIVEPM